ncbi:thioredoxin fold domain-containing protein [Tieghemostelium lacteum]|uniref:Thioredoxin fold domain-containing protein n=1 Tax=Tieghemostelium lacteum TaxID=361077 RepID=A0A151ZFE0_TIELA|nr:thioredoxin fold domain-containing protein [Tieghemostelium lacteum]|eukprot:KYQ92647.1 thioredoxin fold domain-containing protein [Tieghemostelium lacteum]
MGITKKFIVTNPAEFEGIIKEAVSSYKNVFVNFISNIDPTTCSLWCRDCQVSEPIVNKSFDKSKEELCLVECQIARDGYKGNPDHPYRTNPQIQLKAIPTLVFWNQDLPKKTLVEEECHDESNVDKYIASFVNKN